MYPPNTLSNALSHLAYRIQLYSDRFGSAFEYNGTEYPCKGSNKV